jgi:hypothetical protein
MTCPIFQKIIFQTHDRCSLSSPKFWAKIELKFYLESQTDNVNFQGSEMNFFLIWQHEGTTRPPAIYIGEVTLIIHIRTAQTESSHCHQTKQHTFRLGLWNFRVGAFFLSERQAGKGFAIIFIRRRILKEIQTTPNPHTTEAFPRLTWLREQEEQHKQQERKKLQQQLCYKKNKIGDGPELLSRSMAAYIRVGAY